MAAKRYELIDGQCLNIVSMLPGNVGDLGRPASSNRMSINGCLWVLHSGTNWRYLTERYGKWKTVHKRFSRRRHAGMGTDFRDADEQL